MVVLLLGLLVFSDPNVPDLVYTLVMTLDPVVQFRYEFRDLGIVFCVLRNVQVEPDDQYLTMLF